VAIRWLLALLVEIPAQHLPLARAGLDERRHGLLVDVLSGILTLDAAPSIRTSLLHLYNNDGLADLAAAAATPGLLYETGQSVRPVYVHYVYDALDVDTRSQCTGGHDPPAGLTHPFL
jgi:hypothetical protein